MPRPSPSADAHRRTRTDHARELAEDYVEAVAELADEEGGCRVTDLAGRFGVSHVTVIRTVERLVAEGLVSTAPYRPVRLTAKGKRLATACRRRHETLVRFLEKLGVRPAVAAIDAEGIEHHLSPETLRRIEAFVTE
ncbi:MAG: manganese-binding transcriptional regulator MntR [Planctomycetota bacterium]